MKRALLLDLVLGMMLCAAIVSTAAARYSRTSSAQVDTVVTTTFQVNMKIKMREGTFLPASNDSVWVRGNFNNWGTSTLTDGDGDSIYTGAIPVDTLHDATTHAVNIGDTLLYKYFKTLRGGLDWEGVPNREFIMSSNPISTPADYFDNDSVYTPPVLVNVTFQVNMKVKILETTFQPGSGDVVTVPGDINGWNTSTDTLTDPDHDSIYTKTLSLAEGQFIHYKFFKTVRGGLSWEDNQPTSSTNREYVVPVGGGPIPSAYFNGDSIVNTPINENINWRVDMTTYINLGWFQPSGGDTIELRGPNGWSAGTFLSQNTFFPTRYNIVLPYLGTSYDQIAYKFFLKLNAANGETRFPGYASVPDEIQYEHPADRGDGNRIFDAGPPPGTNTSTPQFFFSSINPGGIIALGDSIMVTLKVNMGPATRYLDPFDPIADTVRLIWHEALWRAVQIKKQGAFPDLTMTPVAPGDTIYQVTFKVDGPTHYGMQYTYRYIHPNGASVDQISGLGGQNNYNSRFIQPTSPGVFPASYTAPTDLWKLSSPLPAENAPFSITGVRERTAPDVPAAYKLDQNYPNPFNPTTRINYTVPVRGNISLKVFNLLGQEVATLVNEEQTAGSHFVQFNAARFASGVYYYRIEAGSFREVKKMVLVK